MSGDGAPLLEVEDLRVRFRTRTGIVEAVRGISFSVGRERLGIVGESGSGKTMTGRAILRLIRPPGVVEARRIALDGIDLLAPLGAADAQGARRAHRHGHAGPEILAEPGDAHRPPAHRGAAGPQPASRGRRRGGARSKCWRPCRSAIPSASSTPIRTSSPAAWGSAS